MVNSRAKNSWRVRLLLETTNKLLCCKTINVSYYLQEDVSYTDLARI